MRQITDIVTHQSFVAQLSKFRRPFLMLELMIALSLVAVSVLPLARIPMQTIQEEYKSAYRLQTQRLADLAFAKINEKLYSGEISWKEILSPIKEKTLVFKENIDILFAPRTKQTFLLEGTLHSVGKKGKDLEEVRLATFRVKVTPKQEKFKLFHAKKNRVHSRVYSYQVALSKVTALAAPPELQNDHPIKESG